MATRGHTTPGTVVILGGGSDIGGHIALRTCSGRPVVLTARDPHSPKVTARITQLKSAGALSVEVLPLNAANLGAVADTLESIFARHRVATLVVAFGILGDHERALADPSHAADIAHLDYTAQVLALTAAYQHLASQGAPAQLVAFSSIAGWRARRANFVYGSTKAGLDAFCNGLQDHAHGGPVAVILARPGFVMGNMTKGMDPAPMSVTPEVVADHVVAAMGKGRSVTLWIPGRLRLLAWVMRCVPRPVWRRMPR